MPFSLSHLSTWVKRKGYGPIHTTVLKSLFFSTIDCKDGRHDGFQEWRHSFFKATWWLAAFWGLCATCQTKPAFHDFLISATSCIWRAGASASLHCISAVVKTGWNTMMDSWAWLTIGRASRAAHYRCSSAGSLLCRLCLQLCSVCMRDILAPLLDSGGRRRHPSLSTGSVDSHHLYQPRQRCLALPCVVLCVSWRLTTTEAAVSYFDRCCPSLCL